MNEITFSKTRLEHLDVVSSFGYDLILAPEIGTREQTRTCFQYSWHAPSSKRVQRRYGSRGAGIVVPALENERAHQKILYPRKYQQSFCSVSDPFSFHDMMSSIRRRPGLRNVPNAISLAHSHVDIHQGVQ